MCREVALELLKIIRNDKSKSYARTEAINCFFRIIERVHTDKKMSEQNKRDKKKDLPARKRKTLQLFESPFEIKSSL